MFVGSCSNSQIWRTGCQSQTGGPGGLRESKLGVVGGPGGIRESAAGVLGGPGGLSKLANWVLASKFGFDGLIGGPGGMVESNPGVVGGPGGMTVSNPGVVGGPGGLSSLTNWLLASMFGLGGLMGGPGGKERRPMRNAPAPMQTTMIKPYSMYGRLPGELVLPVGGGITTAPDAEVATGVSAHSGWLAEVPPTEQSGVAVGCGVAVAVAVAVGNGVLVGLFSLPPGSHTAPGGQSARALWGMSSDCIPIITAASKRPINSVRILICLNSNHWP